MTSPLPTVIAELEPGSVAILGLPWDDSSSFVRGAAEAPPVIRQALHSPATNPIVRAYARHFDRLELLHIDAHPDLYDEFEGDRHSHARPFARIMEEGWVQRLVQVGIRGTNPHQQAQADRFGVEVISMRDWHSALDIEMDGPVYLSFDLDALDPAFAPGVAHREAGGLTTRESLQLIGRLDAPLVGADIVELNPARDVEDLTAVVTAKLVKELAARMLDS